MTIKGRNVLLFSIVVTLVLFVIGCGSDSSDSSKGNGSNEGADIEAGGELRIALSAQPATLDQPISTNTSTRDVSRLMFETLLTTNAEFEPVPMLAESVEMNDEGTVYTFHLREGIHFHSGKEMTSEDVVASMERWMELSTLTGSVFDGATFEAEDDYTVILELTKPSALVLDILASTKMAAAIMPKEIVESAGADGVTEYIGTGPFEFVDWKSDQYIHLTKYDDYEALEEEADGLSGKKEALVDDIYFYFVGDEATRITGLQTDEYDIAYSIPFDNYNQLVNEQMIDPVLEKAGELVLIYNKVEGLSSDVNIRKAINTALDINEILLTAFADEDLYTLDHGYMTKEIANWDSDAGSEFHNLNDQEEAKRLLEEAGYANEEFTLMTTRDYPYMYNASVVIQEQLSQIGMNVKLEVYDWPTLAEKQGEAGAWDAFVNALTTVTTPPQVNALSPNYALGVQDDYITNLMKEIEVAASHEEAKEIWDEIQRYAWEEHVPVTILGGYHALYGKTDKVTGYTNYHGGVYWNLGIEK